MLQLRFHGIAAVFLLLGCVTASSAGRRQEIGPSQARHGAVIDVRFGYPAAGEGRALMHSVGLGGSAFVDQTSIVTDAQILDAQVRRQGGHVIIDLLLTEEGDTRLRNASAETGDRQIAVLLNRRLAAVMPVAAPVRLPNNRITLGVVVPEVVAEEIVAEVGGRWVGR